MYASTPRELAPEEDQGVLLSLIKTPQVGNLDYTEQATDRLFAQIKGIPEISHVFTINGFPSVRGAFAGFLLKPWDERTKNQKQVLAELGPKFLAVPQAQVQAFSPPALPGSTGGYADAVRDPDHRRLRDARRRRAQDAAGGAGERPLPVHRRRPQVRYAAIRVQGRRRQGQPHRRQHGRRRHGAGDDARRQLRQSVQPLWPQLPGHSAGAARVSPDARLADPLSIAAPATASSCRCRRWRASRKRCSRTR